MLEFEITTPIWYWTGETLVYANEDRDNAGDSDTELIWQFGFFMTTPLKNTGITKAPRESPRCHGNHQGAMGISKMPILWSNWEISGLFGSKMFGNCCYHLVNIDPVVFRESLWILWTSNFFVLVFNLWWNSIPKISSCYPHEHQCWKTHLGQAGNLKKNKNVFVQLTPLQKLACNISVQNVSKDKTLQVMGEMGGFPNSVGPMVV